MNAEDLIKANALQHELSELQYIRMWMEPLKNSNRPFGIIRKTERYFVMAELASSTEKILLPESLREDVLKMIDNRIEKIEKQFSNM